MTPLEAIAEQKAGIIKKVFPWWQVVLLQKLWLWLTALRKRKMRRDLPTGQIIMSVTRECGYRRSLWLYKCCQTRSLPDWPAWFAPDRECWDGHSFTWYFCQEDGRELASNHLLAQALKETSWPGRLGNRVKRSLDNFGWGPQSPCYQGFIGNLARTLCGLS